MSTNNGEASDLKRRLRDARARNELARLEMENQLLESWGYGGGRNGWPSPYDNPWGGLGPDGRVWLPINSAGIQNRKDGGNRPFVWTEIDLDRARDAGRWLATTNPLAQGALECIADYTVRTGFAYEAQPAKGLDQDGAAKTLAGIVQQVVDDHISVNSVVEGGGEDRTWADREWESVFTSVRDGEAILRCFDQGDCTTLVRPVLPEQLRQPIGSPASWSYGVHTDEQDAERRLGYAVSYGDPDDWQEVDACDVAHLRLNVDSCVKRGLSDFYSTGASLEEVNKLLRAMRISGAAQASIAWVERHTGANQQALNELVAKSRDRTIPSVSNPLTGRDESTERIEPGKRLLVGGGREYLPGPLAANTTQHISIVSACLRAVGARWRMPEYMISGDASNANYASTLVAGSPFVVRVECRQAVYSRFFLRVIWIAVRNAARRGRFLVGGRVYTFEEVSRLVNITATPPQVAIADKLVDAQVDQIDLQNEVISKQHRRGKIGVDSDKIRQDLAEEPLTRVTGKVTDLDPDGNPITGGSQQGGGPFYPRVVG